MKEGDFKMASGKTGMLSKMNNQEIIDEFGESDEEHKNSEEKKIVDMHKSKHSSAKSGEKVNQV